MRDSDFEAFNRGFDWATDVIRKYGKHPHLVRVFALGDPFQTGSKWFDEGAQMAIELGERVWIDQQMTGGYRGKPYE